MYANVLIGSEEIGSALDSLPFREQAVIDRRMALRSRRDIAEELGIRVEYVRVLEQKGLRRFAAKAKQLAGLHPWVQS